VRATKKFRIASHPDCLAHEPFPGHPERPRRLAAALEGARLAGAEPLSVEVDEPRCLEAIARVHAPGFAARLQAACRHAPSIFDSDDNPISAGSYRGAIAAVAATLAAVDRSAAGETERVFVAARPPGHHALRDRAMGFCFFNNAAIAAEELLARGLGPVAIVDFDVHHGNGTQNHFYARDDVYFLSMHRYPFYPGSGAGDEIGEGRGRGFTRNLPMAAGAGDGVLCEALEVGVAELLRAIEPASWVISAGFDCHAADPLGGMRMTGGGFGRFGEILTRAGGGTPLVAVLEGGYDLEALKMSVRAFLEGLQGRAAS
jgi:acetoin utilization deacetylase AcuC-like enzyme